MAKTFDPKCYDLAEQFLEREFVPANYEQRVNALAVHIQGAIEEWLEDNYADMRDERRRMSEQHSGDAK